MLDSILDLVPFLALLNILFTFVVVFLERRSPAVTWAWLIVLLLIPFFGFLLYLVIGVDSRKHKVFAQKSKEDEQLYNEYLTLPYPGLQFLQQQKDFMREPNIVRGEGTEHLNDLAYLNYISGAGALTKNNKVQIFYEGEPKFASLLKDIEKAKSFIHIQYYIVRNDDLGRRVIAALAKKAAEGVEVKMYIDGMGSFTPKGKQFYDPLVKAGGKLVVFLPPHFIRINFRNHRKLCVIDGIIGYLGGFNIGDEYLGKVGRFGHWRDCHIRIVGDAVKQLEIRFIMDWNFCIKENTKGKIKPTRENPSFATKIIFDSKYFPFWGAKQDGIHMQIVSSGPDTRWSSIHFGYAKMAFEADKSIYIVTPYFVPDDSIFQALRIAALSGTDVRIMIPAHPDHPFVYWSSLSYLGELLPAGVRCYKYENGFVHSKLMMIDGVATSVGTANMDIRSFRLNFEINSFIYDQQLTKSFQDKFMEDLNDCTEITSEWYEKRSGMVKIRESFSRLISPLL